MVLLSSIPEKPILLKKIASHFLNLKWSVDTDTHQEVDFIVKKDKLRFRVACIPSKVRIFKSNNEIVSAQTRLAYKNNQDRGLVTVVDFEFPGLPLEDLVKFDLSFVGIDELHLITDLDNLQREELPTLSRRQKLLLRANPSVCLEISEDFKRNQDMDGAIDWVRHALKGDKNSLSIRLKLSELYVQAAQYNCAHEVLLDSVGIFPNNTRIVQELMKISSLMSNEEEEARWTVRLEKIASLKPTKPAVNFSDIIARQANMRRQSNVENTGGFAQPGETIQKSLFGRLSSYLFRK